MAQRMTYKNRPFVRRDDKIIYGDLSEKYITEIAVLSTKNVGGIDIADKVDITLLLSNTSLSRKKRTVKTSRKNGLFPAFDIASVWLSRYCKEQ